MPIPLVFQAPPPPAPPQRPVRTVTISNRGLSVQLNDRANGFWLPREGISGIGLPPVDVQSKVGAGAGARYLRTRTKTRIIDVDFAVFADETPQFRERLDVVTRILDDRYTPTRITIGDGFGNYRWIDGHYTGGFEWASSLWDGSQTRQRSAISFECLDPYFQSGEVVSGTIAAGASVPFIPFGPPMYVAPPSSSGALTITNPGDAEAFPVWTIKGPGQGVTVQSQTDGVGFTINATLAANDYRIVDTEKKTIVDQNGVNRFSELGVAPQFWPLPPGDSLAVVGISGSTTASSIQFTAKVRYRAAYGITGSGASVA